MLTNNRNLLKDEKTYTTDLQWDGFINQWGEEKQYNTFLLYLEQISPTIMRARCFSA
jgi:hypothetical protein